MLRFRTPLAILALLTAAPLAAQPVVTPATPGARTSGSTAADTLRPSARCGSRPSASSGGSSCAWSARCPRSCAARAWTCGSCRCVSTPRIRCSRDRVADHVRGAASHDLRLLRSRRRRMASSASHSAALAGRRVQGRFAARRPVAAPAAGSRTNDRTAELWGDEQWSVLKSVIEERAPKKIAINTSRTFAFADGLTSW